MWPRRSAFPLFAALLWWATACVPQAFAATTPAARIRLPGTYRAVLPAGAAAAARDAVVVRAMSAQEQAAEVLPVELALPMRNFDDLQRRVARGEVIPADEMAVKYYPLAADYAAVADWARGQGLAIDRDDPSRLSVFVHGTAAQLGAAFQVEFAHVAYRGAEYTSTTDAPAVPAAIARRLLAVNGLQRHLRMHPQMQRPPVRPAATTAAATTDGYRPAQIAAAYGATSLGASGRGEVIAIVIDAFPNASDLNTFWANTGISRPSGSLSLIPVGSGPPASPENADEATLDVEWSGAMAPGAALRVYGVPALTYTAIDDACAKIYADAQTATGLHQVSMSFGGLETELPPNEAQAMTQRFAQLASAGIAVFVSSGDGGSTPNAQTGEYDPGATTTTVYPASDPDVTAVGGTSLQLAPDGSIQSETAWSGSGGGISARFARPDWQQNLAVISSLILPDRRLVPDVAAPADPNHGAYMVFQGAPLVAGGTSWSAPVWAGLCAVLNESRIGTGLGPLGFMTPRLYPMIGSENFRDIVSGSNGYYSAQRGFDMCTGIGAPVVGKLLATLSGAIAIKAPPHTAEVLPDAAATFSVTATGVGPVTYQWQRMPAGQTAWQNLFDDGVYQGAQTPQLSVAAVTTAMNGDQFQCVVSNRFGGVPTLPAAGLLVRVPWTVATYTGRVGTSWSTDGTLATATFNFPQAISADAAGNLYVYDSRYGQTTYRKISADGKVTTLPDATDPAGGHTTPAVYPASVAFDAQGNKFDAPFDSYVRKTAPDGTTTLYGKASTPGYIDGPPDKARFSLPVALAVSGDGAVYVADRNRIRKIAPDGTVSTLAGNGATGTTDGIGLDATFDSPYGLTVDPSGNVFVATGNALRMVTPSGAVTTLAGGGTGQPSIDGAGTAVAFGWPHGLAFDAAGNLFICDSDHNVIRRAWVTRPPQVIVDPKDQATTVVNGATFSVAAGGFPPMAYAWQRRHGASGDWANLADDAALSGTKTPVLAINAPTVGMTGDQFRCVVTSGFGSAASAPANLSVAPTFWFGTVASATAPFYPVENGLAVAVASSGTVYVANAVDNTIGTIGADGKIAVFAGTVGVRGAANGAAAGATFNGPMGMAIAPDGTLYVADYYNCAIRKITPGGNVSTLAGGSFGTADGVGAAAQFRGPEFVAVDGAGNVYVADTYAETIRKITPAGVVTTFAGAADQAGKVDGQGASARFYYPRGLAFDRAGNLYVADAANAAIRKITPAGVVTTLPGTFGTPGTGPYNGGGGVGAVAVDAAGNIYVSTPTASLLQVIAPDGTVTQIAGTTSYSAANDGAGAGIRLGSPLSLAFDPAGALYYADGWSIHKGVRLTTSAGFGAVRAQSIAVGGTATLSADVPNAMAYHLQWRRNGVDIPGATGTTLTLSNVTALQGGDYQVVLTNYTGTVATAPGRVTITSDAWLANLSARAYVAPSLGGDHVLIAGFVVAGGDKTLVARGIGPTLAAYGVGNAVQQPRLTLFSGGGTSLGETLGWDAGLAPTFDALGAFPLVAGSADAAVQRQFGSGLYSAIVAPVSGPDGVAMLELYDADHGAPANRLVNVSARGYVGTGGNVLIGGFVVAGTTARTVLIRGIGPALSAAGLPDVLGRPQLALYDGAQPAHVIATNTGWANAPVPGDSAVTARVESATAAAMAQVGAFALAAGSADCAMIVTLPPGLYTAQVSGLDGATGLAMVEIYDLL